MKDPLDRAEYLLKLEGLPPVGQHQQASEMPAGVLDEVFALNEELDEIREARQSGAPADQLRERLETARRPIDERAHRQEQRLQALFDVWDRQVDEGAAAGDRRRTLDDLRGLLQERSYIANLLTAVAREAGTL